MSVVSSEWSEVSRPIRQSRTQTVKSPERVSRTQMVHSPERISSEWNEVSRPSRTQMVKSPEGVRRAVPANILPAQGQRPSMIPRRPKSLTSSIHTVQVKLHLNHDHYYFPKSVNWIMAVRIECPIQNLTWMDKCMGFLLVLGNERMDRGVRLV